MFFFDFHVFISYSMSLLQFIVINPFQSLLCRTDTKLIKYKILIACTHEFTICKCVCNRYLLEAYSYINECMLIKFIEITSSLMRYTAFVFFDEYVVSVYNQHNFHVAIMQCVSYLKNVVRQIIQLVKSRTVWNNTTIFLISSLLCRTDIILLSSNSLPNYDFYRGNSLCWKEKSIYLMIETIFSRI